MRDSCGTLLVLIDHARVVLREREELGVGVALPVDVAPLVRVSVLVRRAHRAHPRHVVANVARIERVLPRVVEYLAVVDLLEGRRIHFIAVVLPATLALEDHLEGSHRGAVADDEDLAAGALVAEGVQVFHHRGRKPHGEARHRLAFREVGVKAVVVKLAVVVGEHGLLLVITHHVHEAVVTLAQVVVHEPLSIIEPHVRGGLDAAQILARKVAVKALEAIRAQPLTSVRCLPYPLVGESPRGVVAVFVLRGEEAVIALFRGVDGHVAFGLTMTDEDDILGKHVFLLC